MDPKIGPNRPLFVLFGSSIVQLSYYLNGWAATLTGQYARKADVSLRGYAGWNSTKGLEVLSKVFPQVNTSIFNQFSDVVTIDIYVLGIFVMNGIGCYSDGTSVVFI